MAVIVTIALFIAFSVRIAEEDYIVNENEGTVTICVEKLGQTAEDITVTIRSVERSPVSADGKFVSSRQKSGLLSRCSCR